MSKKVSIITTTYHDARQLAKVAEQVWLQSYQNIEYVIIDGGSTDETPEVLQNLREKFGDRIVVVSEPDHGIYEAINKGIKVATGDIIGCCFDRFTSPEAIAKMVEQMEREGTDGIHADLNYMKGDRIVRRWHQGQGNIRFGWMPGHPTLYLKKEVYEQFGVYREDYKIAADYEFMIRILRDGSIKLSYLPEVLIHMEHGGTSTNSLASYFLSLKEGHRALVENQIKFAWFTDCCRTLRVLLQFFQRKRANRNDNE